MKGHRSRGYISAKKDTNWVVIMLEVDGTKRYFGLTLDKALEVVSGRLNYSPIYEKERK